MYSCMFVMSWTWRLSQWKSERINSLGGEVVKAICDGRKAVAVDPTRAVRKGVTARETDGDGQRAGDGMEGEVWSNVRNRW